MKALTLRPHWAWFVVSGHKDIENRSWPTRLRGRIWVHASLRPMTKADDAAVKGMKEAARQLGLEMDVED
jgi:hypothetical protein